MITLGEPRERILATRRTSNLWVERFSEPRGIHVDLRQPFSAPDLLVLSETDG